jgi:hypothetical protein
LVKRWLLNCRCLTYQTTQTRRPLRLLDVRDTNRVCVVEDVFRYLDYAALSYRWGAKSLRLDNQTWKILHNGLAASEFPLCISDAIHFSKLLGIPYLWVDSLCMKQDSKEEMAEEMSYMGDIYKGSVLTICAARSHGSDVGFLYPRPEAVRIYGSSSTQASSPSSHLYIRNFIKGDEAVNDTVWNTRGWTLQERIMAPRKVMFCEQKTIWECRECRIGEEDLRRRDGCSDDVDRCFRRYVDCGEDMYLLWFAIVQELSRRDLTLEDDKLPALSGLARELSTQKGDHYVAGLWEHDLVEGLLWRVVDHRLPEERRPRTHRGPTWSWVYVDGQVSFWNCSSEEERRISNINARKNHATAIITGITLELLTKANPFGVVTAGEITLEGLLSDDSDCKIWWDSLDQDPDEYVHFFELARVEEDEEDRVSPSSPRSWSRTSSPRPRSPTHYTFSRYNPRDRSGRHGGIDVNLSWGLVLRKIQSPLYYERVGVYRGGDSGEGSELRNPRKCTICIV